MAKFRKKPIVIEAVLFDGSENSIIEILDLKDGDTKSLRVDAGRILIHTLEGVMEANKGDYVIKGVKGEIYPCKPDIFEQTYERVER